ncbi:MAG: peptidylprolyl isomerase [Planctomycetota bacterium]|nr:peptidylprolyl isomerase [Planctomycetota bacterium]
MPQVVFKTNKGDIVIELFENEAPNTVANFISLVEKKKYDGIKFHRVIPNFMAQGGDPNTLDEDPQNDGQGGPGYSIPCECYNGNARMHFQGSLSMAHAGKDTGGSQFFITHLPTPHLNPNLEEERGHTVFGRVIKGLDIALALRVGDEIESARVLRKRKHPYEPETLPDPRVGGRKPATKKK